MPIIPPFGDSGEALRDAALELLATRRPALVRDIQRAAVRLAHTAETFTADDLRARVVIPAGINPVVVGAALRALAVAGVIRKDGTRNSTRKLAHARPNAVWTLADSTKAAAWLAANPTPDA
jgi:hypothetical protein